MGKQRIIVENLQRIANGEYTYKQLCDYGIFVDGAKTGNAKIAQISDLKQYFEIDNSTKRGKIIILGKKERVEVKRFTRIKVGKYGQDIQNLLIKELYNNKEGKVNWSLNTILEKTSMVNSNYTKYIKDMNSLSKKIDVERDYIEDFYMYHHKNLKTKIETSLNNLKKRGLIHWLKVMNIELWEIDIVYNDIGKPLIDNDDNIVFNKHKISRKATDIEKGMILKYEESALNKLKCTDKSEIISKGLWYKYNKLVYDDLKNNGIENYYEVYEIIFDTDELKTKSIGDFIAIAIRNRLNSNICESIIKCSETRHSNALKQVVALSHTSYSNKKKNQMDLLLQENFVFINKRIMEEIIKK